MYCPKCKRQFTNDISICPDCKVVLVEQLPKDSIEGSSESDAVKLISTSNDIDSGLIMELLRNNDVPCYKKSKGPGGYMSIYMGYSIYGEDIYVARTDYQKAKVLLDELESEKGPEQETELVSETELWPETELEIDPALETAPEFESESDLESELEKFEDNKNEDNDLPFYRNKKIIARIILISYVLLMILIYAFYKFF